MNWRDMGRWVGRWRFGRPDFCFCTLAIHAPYRQRARRLCADLAPAPVLVLTDEPADFADLPVRAVRHRPTGPMAEDYRMLFSTLRGGQGEPAYHDKRFAIQAVLQDFDTAFFLDADTRVASVPELAAFPPGLAVTTTVLKTVAEHLELVGTWRAPAFEDLARELTGGTEVLRRARWCQESCVAVTKDGREERFFSAWGRAAEFMQGRKVFSGEGGVIGLSAACAGWGVDYEAFAPLAALIRQEGGGPKSG